MAPSMEAVLGGKDLLKSIFDQLDLQDICIAAATCQLWYQVANHDDFWKQIDFRGKKVLPNNAAALLRRHPNVEELDLSGLDGSQEAADGSGLHSIRRFVRHVAPYLTKLRRLTFSAQSAYMESVGPYCPIANHLVAQLSCLSSLTCLSLTGMRLVNGSGVHGELAHTGLRRLVLDDTESSGLLVKCPELTSLSMAGAANSRMPNLDEAPALQALDLSRCSKLTEASTRATLMRLTALQELSVSGISNFLDQTVQHLATSLERLTKLDMSRVTGVSFTGVRGFAALRELDLSRCDQLNQAALSTALEGCECLEKLSLDSCNMLSIKLSLPKLQELSVRGCPNMAELEVRAWQLARLDMGPAEGSGQANHSLAKLTVTSGALKRMEWVKLNKLSQLDLDCPALRELLVRDCDFADASVLQTLGDTAVPPLLKSDVLEAARRSAPQPAKPALPSGSGLVAFDRPSADGAEQERAAWAAAMMDEDDLGMEDIMLGDADQPHGDDDDDDEDDGHHGPHGGDGLGAMLARRRRDRAGGGRRGPVAGMMTRMMQLSCPPDREERGWQGPDRLPPELVRFGAAGGQQQGGGAAAASGAAGAAASQPWSGAAAAGSSFSAAAAAAAGGGGGPSSSGGQGGQAAAAGSSQAAASAAAAAAAAPASAAAGDVASTDPEPATGAGAQWARAGSVSDALGMGFPDWLRAGVSASRSRLHDRCFIWGSSGDRLQQVASGQQQPAAADPLADAPAQPPAAAAAAAGDAPEPARRRWDEDAAVLSSRKAQRLQEGAGRLSRALAGVGGPSSSLPQQQQQQQQQAHPAQRQQQQRRRRRLGPMVGGSCSARHPARWGSPYDGLGSAPSVAAAAAAAGAADDEDEEGDWLPSSLGSPSVSGSGTSCSQQDRPRKLHAAFARRPGRGSGDAGGGGDSGGDSSDSDAEAVGAGSEGAARPRRGRIGAGRGGVPRLRVLHVEGCERLQELLLSHGGVEEVVVSGCNSLVLVALHAPSLVLLELQELGDLKGACLQEVSLPSLTMGSCSSLQGIELSSAKIVRLDVRGCGGLQQLHLDCPALQVLDANFCGSLADEGLAAAVANTPPLRQLALSVCCQIGSSGLSSLSQLTTLQQLDLSYTEVSTLQPILDSCPALQSLSIASCRSLHQDALLPLLDHRQPALAQLTSLDASYCEVQDHLVAQLLLRCRKLRHLALSGCAGVTDAIWQQVEGPQLQQLRSRAVAGSAGAGAAAEGAALMDLDGGSQGRSEAGAGSSQGEPLSPSSDGAASSQLESLSLVRCSNLRSLCLGLLPAAGQVELLPPKHYLLSAEQATLQAAPAGAAGWVEVPSAVCQLTSLKVGLSGVQVVALALPQLAHLDLSSCKHLRVLELRCPLLLQLQLQACRSLPVVSAVKGVLAAPHLQMLDVQHMLPQAAGSSRSPSVTESDSRSGEGSSGAASVGSSVEAGDAADAAGGVAGGGQPQADGAGGLLAAVATGGVLPPAVGCSTEAQLCMLLDEVAAAHGSLGPGGILRCTSLCKVCSKLSQCRL